MSRVVKVVRNAACPCGSGAKYKHCCGRLDGEPDFSARLDAAMYRSMNDDGDERQAAVEELRRLRALPAIDAAERQSAEILLVQALQRIGDHHGALALLKELGPAKNKTDAAMRMYWRARSFERLARFEEAAATFDKVLPKLRAHVPEQCHYYLIEIGRAYLMVDRVEDAISVWREAADVLEARGDDEEHLQRVRANLGVALLRSVDPDEVAEGERILYETSNAKALLGDAEGLSNNYSTLSLHYMRLGRWERAIAFARRDLRLTRLIGDAHQLTASLGNLAAIYIKTLQLSSARRCLLEARDIGTRLGHDHTLRMVEANLAAAAEAGREAGKRGITVGEAAPCACNSGKIFKDCCGRADFEPDTPLINFDEAPSSEGLVFRHARPRGDRGRLDTLLAPGPTDRFSWTTAEGHDGWMSVSELPDVANYHLKAARSMAAAATDAGLTRFDEPLAACVLSVCGAEAFINTLCFFIDETAKGTGADAASPLGIAAAIVGEPLAYQRGTELTLKWAAIGAALAGPEWIAPDAWRAFTMLVSIRNELVHFKAAEFEQVSPAPKHLHEILRRLPPEVELRDVPHSWPARLLSASFARWSVATVDALIAALKEGYAKADE
jgi:tetratricopeptide (TPR) repeat protein